VLETLITGDGRALCPRLKKEVCRALSRIEIVVAQIDEVEKERAKMFESESPVAAHLMMLKSIGPEFASTLALEVFFRRFDNRRQLAAYVGLAATPWRSGKIEEEQGISKAGNRRARKP
jgi:transposase